MKHLIPTVICTLALTGFTLANEEIPASTALRAIQIFEADPAGPGSKAAMGIIVRYADSSERVEVTMDYGHFPWSTSRLTPKGVSYLVTAYVAGNMEAQLRNHHPGNRPVDGILAMCRVYKTLRKEHKVDRIAQLETWEKLDRQGVTQLLPLITKVKE